MFAPLSFMDGNIDSVSSSVFSPLHTSSPRGKNNTSRRQHNSKNSSLSYNHQSGPVSASSETSFQRMYHQKQQTYAYLQSIVVASVVQITQNLKQPTTLKPDVICGTESWLRGVQPGKDPAKNVIKSSEVFPESLIVNRNDRPSGLGGGVFTAVQNNMTTDAQPDLTTECEIVWSKVKLANRKNLYLCSFYMPHRNLEDIKKLDESLKKLTNQKTDKTILLSGDFNCPDIDWPSLTVKAGAPQREVQQALVDLSIEHDLTQMHNQPTRNNNILDLVFTNNPSLVKSTTSVPGISDHAMVVTDIDVLPHLIKQKPRKIYIYSKANWDTIKQESEELSNSIINTPESTTTDTLWQTLKSGIGNIMERNIPSKLSRTRKSVPWFNRNLKKMVRRKARLYRQAKKTNQWNTFNAYQKECKIQFKKAEVEHINTTIQKGLDEKNTKPFWRYVKSRRQDNIGISPLKKMGQLVNDSKSKAQILVEQFRSVFTIDHSKELPQMKKQYKKSIPPLIVTTTGVEKLLSSINTSKSIGPDNIANIMLKNCSEQLAPALCHIFQHSLRSGKLPADWRNANITPAYKKGNVHLPENYRPVSLTCVSCKILEHIICKHLLKHLEDNNILTSLNHGFRSGHSCETQLIATMHDLLSKHDQGQQLDMAILDFSKAFDTVPHEKLLYKLTNYGIDGQINNWIRDFLTNRQMRVVVDGESSDSTPVDSGVPQGTVLGPILFLCHINDLPAAVKSQVRLFADDCLLYRTISTIQDHITLQQDLASLERWATSWGMRFNAKKCYIMSINQKSTHFYQLDKHILQDVQTYPYLGVTLSSDLKWNAHITKITKKANSSLGFIRRNLKHCPITCKRTAYISLVRSILEYSSIVWDPYQGKYSDQLERVQRQAARFITGDYKSREEGCITKMLQEQELPSLQSRRSANRLTFLYKMSEGQVPALPCHDYLLPLKHKRKIKTKKFSECVSSNIIENQVTNNSKCFKTFQCRSEQFRHSFFPRSVIDWNHLEDRVVQAKTIGGFKTALHQRL